MIYLDPVLPPLLTPTPEVLKQNPFRYGRLESVLTPNQWEFVYCPEKFVAWVGGVRSSKTWGGIFKSLEQCRIPGNRGIVGRQFASDLEETTQRDFYELADATGLVKNRNDKKIEIYSPDFTGAVLPGKPTAEILFQHLDNPKHIKGHGIGWAWPDEASEVEKEAYFRLVDRLSRKQAEGHYTVFLTSNPEGRNWIWNHWYNPETVEARPMKDRLMHRAIHNRTKDNPFLTEEYLQNLYATAPADWIRRYAEGEFDVFEGQIYKEFSHDIHTVRSRDCKGWTHHQPPLAWPRYLGIDTGGADPWAFEFAAIDYMGNLIWCDEIYRPETYVRSFEAELKKKMQGLTFKSIPMDNENLAAIEELRHMGIRVTKAIKRNKREGAINKLARYLHPNPLRPFPDWHPRAGQMGSPGMFFTERCPKLVEELPQQRWREINGISVNEPDPKVGDHSCDAAYYVVRERPEPAQLPKVMTPEQMNLDLRSQHYWTLVADRKAHLREERRGYRNLAPPATGPRHWVN